MNELIEWAVVEWAKYSSVLYHKDTMFCSSCGEKIVEAGFFVTSVVLLFLVAIEQLYKRE